MKKFSKILSIMLCFLMLFGTVVSASTADSAWTYKNYSGTGHTSDRLKERSGNVYCYPTSGGSVYVTVQKMSNQSAAYSKKVKLKRGTRYTIINSTGANCYVRLKFNSVNVDSTVNSGKWSPDASTNYTVVG